MERHFTATAYIFHEDKVLLHFHKKIKKWLPPGGHIEANETPPEAARREAKEETGLDIAFIEQENIKIKAPQAISFERPFFCLLESIPAHGEVPSHEHMDMIYIAQPLAGADLSIAEKNGFRWFTYEELSSIEIDLLPDTKQLIEIFMTCKT